MVAGCGGKEEAKKLNLQKFCVWALNLLLHRLNSKKKALKNILVLIWTLSAIGKQMGYKVEIMNMGFDALILH